MQREAKGSKALHGGCTSDLPDFIPSSVPTAFLITGTGIISPQVLRAKAQSCLSPLPSPSTSTHHQVPGAPKSSGTRPHLHPQLRPGPRPWRVSPWPQGSLRSNLGPLPPPAASCLPLAQALPWLPWQLGASCTLVPPSLLTARLSLPAGSACASHAACPPSTKPAKAWSCSGLSSSVPSSQNAFPHLMTGYLLSFRFQPSVPLPRGLSGHLAKSLSPSHLRPITLSYFPCSIFYSEILVSPVCLLSVILPPHNRKFCIQGTSFF